MVSLIIISIEGSFANCKRGTDGSRIAKVLGGCRKMRIDVIHSGNHSAYVWRATREKKSRMFKYLGKKYLMCYSNNFKTLP